MDIASIAGLVLCAVMILYGIISGAGIENLVKEYWNVPSAIITFGGAFFATLTSHSLADYISGLKSITLVFKAPALNTSEMIRKIIDLSNVARKEGLLSLEEAAADMDDPFLKKGILLMVDGTDPELVRAIMETELVSIEGRHKNCIGFWDTLGAMGPAWGMIGTLVGLVDMLYHMDNVAGSCHGSGSDNDLLRVRSGEHDLYSCFRQAEGGQRHGDDDEGGHDRGTSFHSGRREPQSY